MTEQFVADSDLEEMVTSFFEERVTHEVVHAAETDGLPQSLWEEASGLGLTSIGIPEETGGSGGSLADAMAVVIASGQHCVPLPLAETYLAGWLLSSAGLPFSGEIATVALPENGTDSLAVGADRVSGVLRDVPWARNASTVVIPFQNDANGVSLAVIETSETRVEFGRDYAGQPRDVLHLDNAPASIARIEIAMQTIEARAALVKSAQIAGAINGASTLTQKYTGERIQFGQPVGRFQAVQLHLVTLAQASALTRSAVENAVAATMTGGGMFQSLATKLIASEQAGMAARAAHQAHGAIGMTREYRLQQFTRRLQAWRTEFGTMQSLSLRLGEGASALDSVSDFITSRDARMEIPHE